MHFYHCFHILKPAFWPLVISLELLIFMIETLNWLSSPFNERFFLFVSLGLIGLTILFWLNDITIEGVYNRHHTEKVTQSLRLGAILFIISEVMLFVGFFWAFFHSFLAPCPSLVNIINTNFCNASIAFYFIFLLYKKNKIVLVNVLLYGVLIYFFEENIIYLLPGGGVIPGLEKGLSEATQKAGAAAGVGATSNHGKVQTETPMEAQKRIQSAAANPTTAPSYHSKTDSGTNQALNNLKTDNQAWARTRRSFDRQETPSSNDDGIEAKTEIIANKNEIIIAKKDAIIENKDEIIAKKDTIIENKDESLAKKDAIIEKTVKENEKKSAEYEKEKKAHEKTTEENEKNKKRADDSEQTNKKYEKNKATWDPAGQVAVGIAIGSAGYGLATSCIESYAKSDNLPTSKTLANEEQGNLAQDQPYENIVD